MHGGFFFQFQLAFLPESPQVSASSRTAGSRFQPPSPLAGLLHQSLTFLPTLLLPDCSVLLAFSNPAHLFIIHSSARILLVLVGCLHFKGIWCFFFPPRQGLAVSPRLASDSCSPSFTLLNAGITGLCHNTYLHFKGVLMRFFFLQACCVLTVSSTFALGVAGLFASLHFLLRGEELGSKLTSLSVQVAFYLPVE